jgi:hypothetical protein
MAPIPDTRIGLDSMSHSSEFFSGRGRADQVRLRIGAQQESVESWDPTGVCGILGSNRSLWNLGILVG